MYRPYLPNMCHRPESPQKSTDCDFLRVIVVVIYRNVMLWFMIDCYSCVRGFDYDSLESIKSCRESREL